MADPDPRTVRVSRDVHAPSAAVFELIADPALQPRWDGNDNLASADGGQRVHSVGDVFRTTLTGGEVRENHVVAFAEGRHLAWRPSEVGSPPPGHEWGWSLDPLGPERTRATQIYDWHDLDDDRRLTRARATTEDRLRSSLDRLAEMAEAQAAGGPHPRTPGAPPAGGGPDR